jgi:hypothetical protein
MYYEILNSFKVDLAFLFQVFLPLSSTIDNWLDVTDLVIARLKPMQMCRQLTDVNLTEWESGVCYNLAR